MADRYEPIVTAIVNEVERAEKLHKPINSLHEGYAVIVEEMEEFWDQVKLRAEKRDPVSVRTELIQMAAMCVRTILNVCDRSG